MNFVNNVIKKYIKNTPPNIIIDENDENDQNVDNFEDALSTPPPNTCRKSILLAFDPLMKQSPAIRSSTTKLFKKDCKMDSKENSKPSRESSEAIIEVIEGMDTVHLTPSDQFNTGNSETNDLEGEAAPLYLPNHLEDALPLVRESPGETNLHERFAVENENTLSAPATERNLNENLSSSESESNVCPVNQVFEYAVDEVAEYLFTHSHEIDPSIASRIIVCELFPKSSTDNTSSQRSVSSEINVSESQSSPLESNVHISSDSFNIDLEVEIQRVSSEGNIVTDATSEEELIATKSTDGNSVDSSILNITNPNGSTKSYEIIEEELITTVSIDSDNSDNSNLNNTIRECSRIESDGINEQPERDNQHEHEPDKENESATDNNLPQGENQPATDNQDKPDGQNEPATDNNLLQEENQLAADNQNKPDGQNEPATDNLLQEENQRAADNQNKPDGPNEPATDNNLHQEENQSATDNQNTLDGQNEPATDNNLPQEENQPAVDNQELNKLREDNRQLREQLADITQRLNACEDDKTKLETEMKQKHELELEIREKDEFILTVQAGKFVEKLLEDACKDIERGMEELEQEQAKRQEVEIKLRQKIKVIMKRHAQRIVESVLEDACKDLKERLEVITRREAEASRQLNAYENDEHQTKKILEEYEKTISAHVSEYSKLKTEHATATRHLANLEVAFSDIHQKYERAKSVIDGFKSNEDTLKQNLELCHQAISEHEQKFEALRVHSEEQMQKGNKETAEMKENYEAENGKLKAIIRRLEIKCASLRESLDLKSKECEELSALCDQITGRD